ncbi:MAG: hypothetical protein N4A70_09450 [Pelagimonas sp.]|jgi:hypothetical protein|nr:hypothetical protein [Pelagimonas sp.]
MQSKTQISAVLLTAFALASQPAYAEDRETVDEKGKSFSEIFALINILEWLPGRGGVRGITRPSGCVGGCGTAETIFRQLDESADIKRGSSRLLGSWKPEASNSQKDAERMIDELVAGQR